MVLVIGRLRFYFPSCASKSWATSFATSSSKCSSSISVTGIDPLFIPERLLIGFVLIKSSRTAISISIVLLAGLYKGLFKIAITESCETAIAKNYEKL